MKELLSRLKSVGQPILYRKGSSIFFQGEVPSHALLILDGAVKAYTISDEGTESIAHLFGAESFVPAGWLNNQSPTALFNYDALNDVRAIKFKRIDLFEALESSHQCEKEYRENLARDQAGLLLRIAGLTRSRAADRICHVLYYLMFRYGKEKTDDVFEIDLKISQETLAKLIGQTRESTTKNLITLKKLGIVKYSSSSYTVRKSELEAYLGEDGFRNIQF